MTATDGTKGKGGRPRKDFTREQIDRAKRLLGRRQYTSRVADELRREFGLGRDKAYLLIEAAQREVVASFAGDGADPLTAVYLFLLSVMASGREKTRDRVAAAAAIIRILGLSKLIKSLQDAGDVDEFLAGILARRAERLNPEQN